MDPKNERGLQVRAFINARGDERARQLRAHHRRLDRQVNELTRLRFLLPREQMRLRMLKKLRLQAKDCLKQWEVTRLRVA